MKAISNHPIHEERNYDFIVRIPEPTRDGVPNHRTFVCQVRGRRIRVIRS